MGRAQILDDVRNEGVNVSTNILGGRGITCAFIHLECLRWQPRSCSYRYSNIQEEKYSINTKS